jgi:hypothetical protein
MGANFIREGVLRMCNTTTIGGDLFIEFLHVFFFVCQVLSRTLPEKDQMTGPPWSAQLLVWIHSR